MLFNILNVIIIVLMVLSILSDLIINKVKNKFVAKYFKYSDKLFMSGVVIGLALSIEQKCIFLIGTYGVCLLLTVLTRFILQSNSKN